MAYYSLIRQRYIKHLFVPLYMHNDSENLKPWFLFCVVENLELIEQGKAGPPREADETDTPVKQEPATPVKSQMQSVGTQHSVRQVIRKPSLVKMEPDVDVVAFDPAMTDLSVQVMNGKAKILII